MRRGNAVLLTFLGVLLIFPLSAPCGSSQMQPGGSENLTVFRKRGKLIELKIHDSGRALSVLPQQTIRVSLSENPTTGYRWQILENGSPVLKLANDTFQKSPSTGVGAGGTRVLEFHTETAGTATLRLGYARASDPASQKNEFVLHVQVAP